MLTLLTDRWHRDCQGATRRDFLTAGTLGLGGLTLPWLLAQKARSAEGQSFVRDKAVVLLFLSGGASHIETFNPNMSAPAPYHSVTGDVATNVPGITFGGTFPLLARHADKFAIVRSFQHPIGGHVQAIVHMLTGGTDRLGEGAEGYSLGAMFARMRGANHPRTGMPTFALLNSEEVDDQYRNEKGRVERGSRPGLLGPSYGPFVPGGEGPAMENMVLSVPRKRLDDRRALLDSLDGFKRQADANAALDGTDRYKRQAFDLILGSAAEAFDLTREDPRIVERYDTRRFRVGKKVFRESELGRHMLTARRLIEAGCGFVTVHSAGWDMHADRNNPGIHAGMEMLGRPLDRAVSAFLADLEDRGLLDRVLLIITGDFGRSPKINNRGGRDHWTNLCTLAFAGGGGQTGQIIGQSARNNDVPLTEPIGTDQLLGTVMHKLFDVGLLRLRRGIPRELLTRLENSPPIVGLI